jgi:uncharacterized delta-60 repeat protein
MAWLVATLSAIAQPGPLPVVVDPSFDPGAGPKQIVTGVQPLGDGKILVWGEFYAIGGFRRETIARLHTDGSVDPDFNFVADGFVSSAAVQQDGNVIISGSFMRINGVERMGIARLDAKGAVDATFVPDAAGVRFLGKFKLQADGKIVGFGLREGAFAMYRWQTNGAVDSTFVAPVGFGENIPGSDYFFVFESSGAIVAPLRFVASTGGLAWRIARLLPSGNLDAGYAPDPQPVQFIVPLILQADGKLLIQGKVNGGESGLFRLNTNGTPDTTFQTTVKSLQASAAAVQPDGRILLVGNIEFTDGSKTSLARFHPNGSRDPSLDPEVTKVLADASNPSRASIGALGLQADGKIIVGGLFQELAGVPRAGLARIYGDSTALSAIDFRPARYRVTEGNASIALTVARRGSTNGAVGVSYATSNLSATAGADYVTASGIVVFAPGEIEKTIRIALLDDGLVEGHESFNVTLQNPTSIPLGLASVATVDITDNEHPVMVEKTLKPGTGVTSSVGVGSPHIYDLTELPDGKMLAIGNFTHVQGVARGYIARLNTDATLDPTFSASVTGGDPYSMIVGVRVQPDGKIVIVGTFTTVGGASRKHIARLNVNGSLDVSFNPGTGPDQPIPRIELLPGGQMLIAGQFNTYAGVARQNLARLNTNGVLDTTFDAGSFGDGAIYSIALQTNGDIIAGGSFTNVAGVPRACIARFGSNGSLDMGSAPLLESPSYARPDVQKVLLQSDGRVVLASFQMMSVGGAARGTLARLNTDGSLDASFNTSLLPGGYETAVVIQPDRKIVASGNFAFDNGDVRQIIRLNPDGSRDEDFDSEATINSNDGSGGVGEATVAQNGTLLISGPFTNVAGLNFNGLARLFIDSGTRRAVEFTGPSAILSEASPIIALPIRRRGPTDQPMTVQASTTNGSAVAGLDFSNVNAQVNFAPLQTEASTAVPMINDFLVETDETFGVVLSAPTEVGLGLSQLTVTILDDDRPGSLDLASSTRFSVTNAANRIFVWHFAALPDGRFFGTLISDSYLSYEPQLLRFHADGSPDPAFPPMGFVRFVGSLTNGEALIARNRTNLIRLTATGEIDPGFHASIARTNDANADLSGVSLEPSGRMIIFGNFHRVNGMVRTGIARLNSDGSLDPGYQPNLAHPFDPSLVWVYAATFQADNRLLVAGNFETVDGVSRVGVARLLTNGTLDTAFTVGTGQGFVFFGDPAAPGAAYALALQPDGKIFVGGQFDRYNGIARNSLVRLNTNGTLDTTFSIGAGFQVSTSSGIMPGRIEQLFREPDGGLLVRGGFSRFSGLAGHGLIRLNSNGTRDLAFELSGSTVFPQSGYFASMLPLPDGDILAGMGDSASYGWGLPSGAGPLLLGPIVRLNGDPALRIVGTERATDGVFRLQINSLLGHSYRCDSSTNLVD